jgi:hypothetical protein
MTGEGIGTEQPRDGIEVLNYHVEREVLAMFCSIA